MKKVLFIHGFASSGQSAKADDLRHILDVEVIAPNLSHQPLKDLQTLENIILNESVSMIVGSSLGGFYGLILALRHPCKLVLINPSLRSHLTLVDQLGKVESFKGGGFIWTTQQIDELQQLSLSITDEKITAKPQALQQCLVLLAQHDERLNYQDACKRLTGATIIIDPDQDHRFSDLQRYQTQLNQFFKL